MLLWKRYVNNKMAAMRFLHLQQYSHRLNLLCFLYDEAATGPGPPHNREFTTHSDTTHLVGLLWTSDQPDAETSIL